MTSTWVLWFHLHYKLYLYYNWYTSLLRNKIVHETGCTAHLMLFLTQTQESIDVKCYKISNIDSYIRRHGDFIFFYLEVPVPFMSCCCLAFYPSNKLFVSCCTWLACKGIEVEVLLLFHLFFLYQSSRCFDNLIYMPCILPFLIARF